MFFCVNLFYTSENFVGEMKRLRTFEANEQRKRCRCDFHWKTDRTKPDGITFGSYYKRAWSHKFRIENKTEEFSKSEFESACVGVVTRGGGVAKSDRYGEGGGIRLARRRGRTGTETVVNVTYGGEFLGRKWDSKRPDAVAALSERFSSCFERRRRFWWRTANYCTRRDRKWRQRLHSLRSVSKRGRRTFRNVWNWSVTHAVESTYLKKKKKTLTNIVLNRSVLSTRFVFFRPQYILSNTDHRRTPILGIMFYFYIRKYVFH